MAFLGGAGFGGDDTLTALANLAAVFADPTKLKAGIEELKAAKADASKAEADAKSAGADAATKIEAMKAERADLDKFAELVTNEAEANTARTKQLDDAAAALAARE